MTFRRGFKSQCERRSVEFRRQLNLKDIDCLNWVDLAKLLHVRVLSTNDIDGVDSETLSILNDEADDSWSALTMRIGTSNIVVFKPASNKSRVNSVVMHELAHIILGHDLADAFVTEDGSLTPSNFDQDQEDEADWLAGTLLLPRPALVHIRKHGLTDSIARTKYQVSNPMLTWRIRMTGIDYQLGVRKKRTRQ